MKDRKNPYPYNPFTIPGGGPSGGPPPGPPPSQVEGILKSILGVAQESWGGLRQFIGRAVKISLPDHLYVPENAQSLDIANIFDLDPLDRITIVEFTSPPGAVTRILSYALFNDGLLAPDYDFYPTVDGRRVYAFHGDPLDRFRLYLGRAPDLSNSSLIHGPITLQPGQTLRWEAENRSGVVTTMGVRVVGYVDRAQNRSQTLMG